MPDLPETPLDRQELYLANIAGQGDEIPPYPVNREEQYLSVIAGKSEEMPDKPLTRKEQYLAYIAENGAGGPDDYPEDDYYEGDYDISPSPASDRLLATGGKTMYRNTVIRKIPKEETIAIGTGTKTVTIGTGTVTEESENVAKVSYYGRNLVDMTGDNVMAEALLDGYTAHGADGRPVNGTLSIALYVNEETGNLMLDYNGEIPPGYEIVDGHLMLTL